MVGLRLRRLNIENPLGLLLNDGDEGGNRGGGKHVGHAVDFFGVRE